MDTKAQDMDTQPTLHGTASIRDTANGRKLVLELDLPAVEADIRANTKGRPYVTVKPESAAPLRFAVQGHAVEVTQGLVVNVPLKLVQPGAKPDGKPVRRFTFGAGK
jgi:hypothetical protein